MARSRFLDPNPNVIGECMICALPVLLVGHLTKNCASHPPSICRACLKRQVEHAISCDAPFQLRCFRCNTHIEDKDLVGHVPTKIFEKYSKLLTLRMLRTDSAVIHCSDSNKLGCKEMIHVLDGDKYPIVTCHFCLAKTCFTCKSKWHGGLTCREYQLQIEEQNKEQLRKTQWFLSKNTKSCPKCGHGPCFKEEEECDIARCPQCQFKFCWTCLADYHLILKNDLSYHKPSCRFWCPQKEE